MRIFNVLDKIENAIYNSRRVPLSDLVLVRKDKILNLIEKTRKNLPREMKQARFVSQENQRIMQEAQVKAGDVIREAEKRANDLLKAAREESRSLLDKEKVVENARKRAEEILSAAQKEAEERLSESRAKANNILKSAQAQAWDMTRRAKEEAKATRQGADQYALKIFSNMENEFSRILKVIQKSRAALEQAQKEEQQKEQKKTREIQKPPGQESITQPETPKMKVEKGKEESQKTAEGESKKN